MCDDIFGGCLQPEIALSLYLGHVWPAAGEPPVPRGGLNALTCNLQPEQQRQQTSSFPYYETRGVSCGDFSISLLLLLLLLYQRGLNKVSSELLPALWDSAPVSSLVTEASGGGGTFFSPHEYLGLTTCMEA